MNLTTTRSGIQNSFRTLRKAEVRPNSVYMLIIILALVAFEAFNYSTTAYALRDLLGDLRFAGLRWATLMALAFCGLDFAGFSRLITQKNSTENHKESWYLFSAWLIAAAFNATLTWWGVAMAISNHTLNSSLVASTKSLTTIVPVIVAIMVWVIRLLIIGSLTSALEHSRVAHNSISKDRPLTRPTGFQANSQPGISQSRPQPVNMPSRSIAARAHQGTMYQKTTTGVHAQRNSNDFMAAENQTRNL